MTQTSSYKYKAKPFVKWAGGKAQLLNDIECHLSQNLLLHADNITYVEPFVGGGATVLYLLSKYPNIRKAVINDINPRLITTYRVIKYRPLDLIKELSILQETYIPMNHENRTNMFLEQRKRFNEKDLTDIQTAALFIFLNRTCFNGLYRENSKGQFNVPHGRYANPLICDQTTLLADSEILQRVEILCGDYSETMKYAGANTLFYFDPPYKPLSETSSFNSYVKEVFDDREQIRLHNFCDAVSKLGSLFLLSNSDVKEKNPNDTFFDDLYANYFINRVYANRMLNANPQKRGKISELLITNFANTARTSENQIPQIP